MDDFKTLWGKQPSPEQPDSGALIRRAVKVKQSIRNKWMAASISCLLTGVFLVYLWIYIEPLMISTKAGIVLVLWGILAFVLTTAGSLQLLFKSEAQKSNSEFLEQMLQLKKKQDYLHKRVINLYFLLISVGVSLYMYEFALKMTHFWAFVAYGMSAGWLAFNWFYLKPVTVTKQSEKLNQLIASLEEINRQTKE